MHCMKCETYYLSENGHRCAQVATEKTAIRNQRTYTQVEVNALIAGARLHEMTSLPVHAWPDSGATYPHEFFIELLRYIKERISELERQRELAPDAARPALEREKQIEQLIFAVQSLSDSILVQEQREQEVGKLVEALRDLYEGTEHLRGHDQ